jgi:tight adherence protein C
MGIPFTIVLAAGAVVTSILLLLWGIAGWGASTTKASSQHLLGAGQPTDQRVLKLQEGPLHRAVVPVIRVIANRVRRITPAGWLESLQRRVVLAGPESVWTTDRALAAKIAFAAIGLAAGLWVSGTIGPLPAVVMPIVGYFLPDALLNERSRERQKTIGLELPDTLDQITISVEAGLGFEAALAYVAETGHGPLAGEIVSLLSEIRIGVPRETALRNLVDRTDVAELRHFVFALRQAEQYGLPIAQVLRVQSKELRVTRRQRAEERALKMPVKLLFPLALCIFPTIFVVLLAPAMIRISQSF